MGKTFKDARTDGSAHEELHNEADAIPSGKPAVSKVTLLHPDIASAPRPGIPANPTAAAALVREVSLLRTIVRDARMDVLDGLTEDMFVSNVGVVFQRLKALANSKGKVPSLRMMFGGGFDLDGCSAYFDDPNDPLWQPYDTPEEVEDALANMHLEQAKRTMNTALGGLFQRFDEDPTYEEQVDVLNKMQEAVASVTFGKGVELTQAEEIAVFLEKQRGQRATVSNVRNHMKISSQRLSNIMRIEEKRDNPAFRRTGSGRKTTLLLTRGLAHMETLDWKAAVQPDEIDKAFLPDQLRPHFGVNGHLIKNIFWIMSAFGDGGKTTMLMNIAITNAKAGKRVLYINHELDSNQMLCLVAQMVEGRFIADPQEAQRICKRTSWVTKNLDVKAIMDPVAIEEITKWIREQGYEVVVWDYLNPTFLTCDDTTGTSPYDRFGQFLGTNLVDHGIPLFTAVQGGWKHDDVRPTWFHRSNIGLILLDAEFFESKGQWRATFKVYKNKHKGIPSGGYLDVYYCTQTNVIDAAIPIQASEFRRRMADKAKAPEQKAKEDAKQRKEEEEREKAERRVEKKRQRDADEVKNRKPIFGAKDDLPDL